MSIRKLNALCLTASSLLILAVLGQPAVAADLDTGYGDAPPPEAEQKVEFGSGWYIRGDLGAATGLSAHANDDPYYGTHLGPAFTPPTLTTPSSSRLTYNATIGGGYQFNRWFRADATVDFLQPQSDKHRGASRACWTGVTSTGTDIDGLCAPTLQSSLKSYAAMVNAYLDLGTWGIISPYVGAGVGLSFGNAQASSAYFMANGEPYNITITDPSTGAKYKQYWDRSAGTEYYNLAYALMAGVAVDVADHTKIDIGYRYLALGKVLGSDLKAQEVRAGVRYMLDN